MSRGGLERPISTAQRFRVEELYEFGGDDVPPADNTRDGKHIFWGRVEKDGEAGRIVWDGVPGPRLDGIVDFDGMPVVFSPDRRHVAWVGARGRAFAVFADGELIGEWDELLTDVTPAVGANGRVGFLANIDARPRVVLDGDVMGAWEVVPPGPFLSRDGERVAFVAHSGSGKFRVVVDGVEGPSFDEVGSAIVDGRPRSVFFSDDGRRFAYAGLLEGSWHVVVDGEIGPGYDGFYGSPIFSPDGSRFAYQAVAGDKAAVVDDGVPGELYDNIGRPVFSSDGKRVMHMAKTADGAAMVVDGERGEEFDDVYMQPDTDAIGYGFSPDARHFGYLACEGKRFLHSGKWFAVVDGRRGPQFDDTAPWLGAGNEGRAMAGEPRFSPDGTHFAFPARAGKKWSMIVDGAAGEGFHLVGFPRFSASGRLAYFVKLDKKRAAFVLDGELGPALTDLYAFDGGEPCVFSPDGRHLVYEGMIEGAWRPVVDNQLGPAIPVGPPLFADDGTIVFFGLPEPDPTGTKPCHICRIAYSPEGE